MRLRLEEKPIEIDGRVYKLRCNMAVLDALEEAHDGDLSVMFSMPPRQGASEILAAMLNDYAEDMGWEQDWTPKRVRKTFSIADIMAADVMGLFQRALTIEDAEQAPADGTPGDQGN